MTEERIARTRVFLSWLREASIRHRGRIRFVVAGSIGLEPLVSRAGISETLNAFVPLRIEPWDRATALAFIADRSLRSGLSLAEGAGEALVDRIGCLIPHHVAMFVHFLRADARRRKSTDCTPDDVERVYQREMLSVHGHVELATYEDRLSRVVDPALQALALELLTEAACVGHLTAEAARSIVATDSPEPKPVEGTLRFLLGVFVHDGYLEERRGRFEFTSTLLCDWWRRRFGFEYVPVSER